MVRQIDISAAERAASEALDASRTKDVTAVLERHMGDYVDLELLEAGRLPVP
jgi:hypothetical protein